MIVLIFLRFVYLIRYLAVVGLHCCTQAFCSCREEGLLFVAAQGLLTVVASLAEADGCTDFNSCITWPQ